MALVPKSDTYSANVSLLVGFDDGLVDSSGTPKTLTAFANAAVSTAQKRYGTSSCLFDGTGDYLKVDYDVALSLGSGDFTLEASVYLTALPPAGEYGIILGKYEPTVGKRSYYLGINPSGYLYFVYSTDGTATTTLTASAEALTTGAWYDVCAERIGSTLKLYVNGVVAYSGSISGTLHANTQYLMIGALLNAATGLANVTTEIFAYLDEIRITKGVGRYGGAYTPEGFFEVSVAVYSNTILESVTATETPAALGILMDSLFEFIDASIAASATGGYGIIYDTIDELVALEPNFQTNGILGCPVTETSTLSEALLSRWTGVSTISETVSATELITAPMLAALIEQLSMGTSSASNAKFTRTITASLSMRESVVLSWEALATATATITDASAGKFEIAVALVDQLITTGVVASRLQAIMSVAVPIVLDESLSSGKGVSLSESLTLTPDALSRLIAVATALESLQMTATPSMTLRLSLPITETATLNGSFSASAKLRDLISEGVTFELSFNTGDSTYTGWVMNTQNFGVTEYQDYPFNSLTKFNRVYLGANSNGVYKLEGATDAGAAIAAMIKTGVSLFPAKTSIPEAFLVFRSDGSILIKTITDEKIERWYTVTGTENISRKRAKMAQGVKSSFWQFELANIDGASLELESLELVPFVSSRKI